MEIVVPQIPASDVPGLRDGAKLVVSVASTLDPTYLSALLASSRVVNSAMVATMEDKLFMNSHPGSKATPVFYWAEFVVMIAQRRGMQKLLLISNFHPEGYAGRGIQQNMQICRDYHYSANMLMVISAAEVFFHMVVKCR